MRENFLSVASSVKKIFPNKIVSLYSIFFSKIVYQYRFNRYIFEYRCPPMYIGYHSEKRGDQKRKKKCFVDEGKRDNPVELGGKGK